MAMYLNCMFSSRRVNNTMNEKNNIQNLYMQCNYNYVKYIEHLEIIFETHHMKTDKTEK